MHALLSTLSWYCEEFIKTLATKLGTWTVSNTFIENFQIDEVSRLLWCDEVSISSSTDEVCYVIVPAILGLSRALKGSAKSRAAAFREICGEEGEGGGEEGGRGLDFRADDVVKIKNMVSGYTGYHPSVLPSPFSLSPSLPLSLQVLQVINPQHLKQLSVCLDSVLRSSQSYPYRSLPQVLHCSLITLLRDCVTASTRRKF